MTRVQIQPRLLEWAKDRAGLSPGVVRSRFAKYDEWLIGTLHPTFKQLQDFARATHTAIGCFFLNEPPVLAVPIPDFRTSGGVRPDEPSPDLLDTIYLCQQRQDWYVSYARATGADPVSYIGTASIQSDIRAIANAIRSTLQFDISIRRKLRTWEEALRHFIQIADDAGILVMVSGVVASNNTRKLDPAEFRGFALSNNLAPLVFINGSDTKSAQMFTLAHELAHLWLGQSGLSDATVASVLTHQVERWCDRVAAEVLVPLDLFKGDYDRSAVVLAEMQRLARVFKVSTLVILRRMHDAGGLDRERFWTLYQTEVKRLREMMAQKAGGGDYYRTTASRVSHRFTRAIVTSALEGRSTFTEAFRLLGCRKMSTFTELGYHVGVAS
jgi:Zn-dependent peptidase ImmA (M78 family)